MAKIPESISIDTGIKNIDINVDGSHKYVISFNVNDLIFVEKLHALYFGAKAKTEELKAKAEEQVKPELDENGMPLEINSFSEESKEINIWFREEFDDLLGSGTSEAIFGSVVFVGEKLDVYIQLLTGLLAFIEPARQAKVKKYTPKKK